MIPPVVQKVKLYASCVQTKSVECATNTVYDTILTQAWSVLKCECSYVLSPCLGKFRASLILRHQGDAETVRCVEWSCQGV